MSILKIDHLTKYYGNFKALDDVSIVVNKNEVYGFIGRNGAGKTTTINTVLSFLEYDSGTIMFEDKPITIDSTDYKRLIGYVPDVPSFPRYLTAREFLMFAYDSHGLSLSDRKATIDQVFADVQLSDTKQKIHSFSRGMKQRLAIAQALLNQPKLLIMDEPTSALDPLGRRDVLRIIQRLKDKMTVFYSTHILEDAQKVCDRIGLIENGKIILEDTVENITKKQKTLDYAVESSIDANVLFDKLSTLKSLTNLEKHQLGVMFTIHKEETIQEVIKFLIDEDIDIIALKKLEKSLEDVFVEVLHENTV